MTQATRLWPLLTASYHYDKSISTYGRGHGTLIEAPILAYLIETANGRILYDVGCDYRKIADPQLREKYYGGLSYGAPEMREEQRVPRHLARLCLTPADIDVVFVGHLHFDHAGGLCDVAGCDIHVQQDELDAARSGEDHAVFADDFAGDYRWRIHHGEYELVPGVRAIATPGHTAGHMSLEIELPKGRPVILCGDAADLVENIEEEIAPGVCWKNRHEQALASLRKLKAIAREEGAALWPNHDISFYRGLRRFPQWHD